MVKDGEYSEPRGFWDYALRIYGRDPVREICLALQDHHKADVNLLLFLCWRAEQGVPVPATREISAMIDRIEPVRELAILPLRSLRVALRTPLQHDSPTAREIVRQRVLEAEIAAEGLAQALLEEGFPLLRGPVDDKMAGATAALCRYLAVIGMPEDKARQAAADLAAAAIDG